MPEKLYECTNAACPLGSRETPGHFTAGLTEEGRAVLGLAPDAPTGDGICPTCGRKGKAAGTFEAREGSDPNEKFHKAIAARVADEDDELTAGGAQDALLELVGEEEA